MTVISAASALNNETRDLILLDASAAARLLGISSRMVAELARRGDLPSKRIGRLRRFSPEELRVWAASL